MTETERSAVFEYSSVDEFDNLLNWANKLDDGPSTLPEDLRVGDLVVRRPGGEYQVYRRPEVDTAKVGTAKADGRDFDVERAHIRLEIFKASSYLEAGKTQLEKAQEVEDWVFGN